jgi:hypothetical protein
MLTYVHKVIHKVVGTFARVLRKRSLEVTGSWPRGHLRVQSVQAEARAKKLSERTQATVHRRVRCIFAGDQTQCVSVRCK